MNDLMFLPKLNLLVKIEQDKFGEHIVIPKGKGQGLLPENKKIYLLRETEAEP
jgi:hypothetical protein